MSTGKILDFDLDRGLKTYPMDVTTLETGVYTLEIRVDDRMEVRKIAIAK